VICPTAPAKICPTGYFVAVVAPVLALNLEVAGRHQGVGCMSAIHPLQGGAEFSCDEYGQTIPPARHHRKRCRSVGAGGLGADAIVAGGACSGPVGQATEQVGPSARDHLIFRTKRFEIRSHEASSREAAEPRASEPRTTGTSWNQVLSTAAASLGLLAIVFAVFAVILREEKLLASVAAVLGVAAIAVQVWWALVVVAVAIVIINAFLS
jgi:hypothetical protein